MKCIVGLGNPGKRFEQTRHNIGFIIIDELAKKLQLKLDKQKFNGLYASANIDGEKVILLKPQTYMNLSGESIKPMAEFYGIEPKDIVVIYDDLDLPNGKIRLRQKGGHGGHNGIRSTIDQLGTKEFKRLRVGIGRPTAPIPVPDYVLGKFTKEEQIEMKHSVTKAVEACELWLYKPFEEVMNTYNQ